LDISSPLILEPKLLVLYVGCYPTTSSGTYSKCLYWWWSFWSEKIQTPKWWIEGKKARTEAELRRQIEAVERRIDVTKKNIDVAPDLYRMQRLIEKLQVFNSS